jgi:2'-5' RNA ligase
MMNIVYSILLIPGSKDEEYLNKIVSSLAKKYKAYPFIPHLTLYAATHAPKEIMVQALELAITDVKPFSVKSISLESSEEFTKGLYIQFETNAMLEKLYTVLNSQLKNYREYSLNPHLSLIYSRVMSLQEKNEYIKSHPVIDRIGFNRCAIISGSKPITNEEDVKDWQIVYEKFL